MKRRMPKGRVHIALHCFLGVWVALLLTSGSSTAQDLKQFESRLTEFTLSNGLKFLVLERHEAPVVTCYTHANVGAVDEVTGITGLAHIFEHMAFKGTRTIGTKDYAAEAKIMGQIDDLFQAIRIEKRKGDQADPNRLADLAKKFQESQKQQEQYLVHDEFDEALKRAGGVGLNASTGADATVYFVNLPSNKLELWMLLESDRFRDPVLREFYREKNVVMEERRLRTETQPTGKLLEDFLSVAYKAHPYGRPVIGHMSDLENMSRSQAEAFFKKYYNPSNLTIAIVGDVDPKEVRRMADEYFGRIPTGPKPDPVWTIEPQQQGERRVTIEDPAQPFVLIGYHKPSVNHPDNAVFDALTDIVGVGRTSRLYRSLVRDKGIAMDASAFPGLPGDKYPSLFLFYAAPAQGHTNQECEEALYVEINKLKSNLVTPEELQKAKTRARAALVRELDSNSGLAEELTHYEVITGNWRNLFRQLERIDHVTAEDIQRVAKTYFISTNKTVGTITTTATRD
jgi:predicted Zn-dependent peptidase